MKNHLAQHVFFGKKGLRIGRNIFNELLEQNTQKTALQVILYSRKSCLILKNMVWLHMCH